MKIVVFDSLNIDKVYSLPHFVHPEETLSAMKKACRCSSILRPAMKRSPPATSPAQIIRW